MSAARRAGIGTVVFLSVAAAGIWLARPLFHGLVMGVYTTPALVQAAIFGVLGLGASAALVGGGLDRAIPFELQRVGDAGAEVEVQLAGFNRQVFYRLGVLGLTGILVLSSMTLAGPYTQEHISQSLAVEDTDELPEIDAERPRVLPKSVAEKFASNSLQYPRYQVAASDIAIRDGKPTWSFGLAPNGALNQFLLIGKGAVFVDMSTQQKRVEVVEADPQVGFGYGLVGGTGIVSEYRWRLLKEEFLVTYTDPIMVEHDDGLYMAVPYISYDHHVRFTPIPLVYATPEWGGVALVNPDGSTEHLSPDAARDHPVLEGQRLFPFELARFYVESMRYQRGIVNKWFVHEDELEVAPVPGSGNDQPFLAVTETDGIQYFVAAEPYGDAQGIYQVWMFDARTGQAKRFLLPIDSALMGPRRAADFVRKANDRTDWDRFSPSEPVPAVIDGTLYWQVRVIPSDSSGIAYTAFVDAENGDVFTFSTDEGIQGFLSGSLDEDQIDRTGGDETAFIITIRAENGTVVNTVRVAEGQSIEIQHQNGTATNTTAS